MAFWDKIGDVANVSMPWGSNFLGSGTGAGLVGGGGFVRDAVGGAADSLNRAKRAEELYGGVDPEGDMRRAAAQAQQFGRQGVRNYGSLGTEATRERGYLRGLARGQDSISAEQLRQGLQQNIAGQQAIAASARPGMGPMAARQASMNAARMGSGMAGQQALAGLQERQQAQQLLQQALLQQRQQELMAAQAGQQTALAGYGGIEQARTNRYGSLMEAPTPGESIMGGAEGLGTLIASASDRRLKRDIKSGDEDAERLLKGLRAYRYRYRDEKHGKGEFVGPMAQNLLKSKAGRAAVFKDPDGHLMVHGARLSLALAGAAGNLDKRLRRIEGKAG